MNNYNWILPSLLISAMTVTLLPVLPNQVSHAEKRPAQPSFSWWNLFGGTLQWEGGKGAPRQSLMVFVLLHQIVVR